MDKKSEWLASFKDKILPIKSKDINPKIFEFFNDNSDNMFEFLYKREGMNISNRNDLKRFFNKFFKGKAEYLEMNCNAFHENEGKYPNDNVAYFFKYSNQIIKPLINSEYYPNLYEYFQKMYLKEVNKFKKNRKKD